MDDKARRGRWVLVTVIVVTTLAELAVAGLSVQAGGLRGSQFVRVLLTGWLLWRAWDGAGWARWILTALCLASAGFAVVAGLASPAIAGRPEVLALLIGYGVVAGVFGIGLMSPWVGAYQEARRRILDAAPYWDGM